MKIIRISQSWYTEEEAKTTTDPKILSDILSSGEDDYVSWSAAENPNCPPEALAIVLNKGKNDFVSYYAAKNHNCPPEYLAMVLNRGKDNVVSQMAARNPNCPPETLAMVLNKGKNDWVSQYAAKNPNCPPETLAMVLNRGKNNFISQMASQNPNCPPEARIKWMMDTGKIEKEDSSKHIIDKEEIKEDEDLKRLREMVSGKKFNLIKISQSWYTSEVAETTTDPKILSDILSRGKNDWVSWYAVQNENCLPETLAVILSRGSDDLVSRNAAQNPNCPPEARIKWMMDTGQIEKEDPSKHVIEYQGKQNEEDEDLKRLREMVSGKKFNLIKISQTETWYTERNALSHTTDPKILSDILNIGKDDAISQYAALNPNCPPEALAMVLNRGNNDYWVSYYAAKNHNCPPEYLAMVLSRGKNDNVSKGAVQNENCPPEVLAIVLSKGNNDTVSQYAAENPNCPPELLTMILNRGKDDSISQCAAENPNCPPESLAMVLNRGSDDAVSQYAAENPNCPPKEKIKWMMDTGKIEKEDPSKHIIDKEEIKEDEDLKRLREMASGKKFNLKTYRLSNRQIVQSALNN